jgi:Tfp pilus assembly protein PilE
MKLRGFTLIETVIYTGLVALILGIFSTIVYTSTTNVRKETDKNSVLENQVFVKQKIDSLLNGVSVASVVPTSGSAATLSLTYPDTSQAQVSLINGAITITRTASGVSDANKITNNRVTASNLLFTRATVNGQPTLTLTATLAGTTTTSQMNQTFYLK